MRSRRELVSVSVFFDITKSFGLEVKQASVLSMVFIVSSYLLEPNSKNPNSPKQKIVDEGHE